MADQARIDRIKDLEAKADRLSQAIADLEGPLAAYLAVSAEGQELVDYYEGPLWQADWQADQDGQIPSDLKRGILSEDGLYNLLGENDQILADMADAVAQYHVGQ
ncbi:hypothetical protein AWM75_03415 [Aerococcus urinaehominis]|uniref:Uncharacterized protein n=1 Tax=Aerococcus urinaehominis TaxID=128944 RepID=A0A0X8FKQ5_9LACT|nr:DUF4298 domain-containing protein [Aerococcus urinaehominis]AMB99107.1 hypothetical protein AWM75_03415 [Aerococcus urinaehominis]SDM03922.1 protein of unknown function [Aerococcus urinaehominis]